MTITSSRPATPSYVPSRRTVLRAAAWTAPAVTVAVAVPAYAACSQPAVTGSIDWDARSGLAFSTSNDRTRASATYSRAGAAPLVLSVSTKYVGSMIMGSRGNAANQNFNRPSRVGGLPLGGLAMHQSNTRRNPRQWWWDGDRRQDRGEYTFTFNRPVKNLSFYLTDIDSASGDFLDAVELSSGFVQQERAGRVTGAGTSSTPYKSNASNVAQDNVSGGGGNVRVLYPGPVSSFTVTYWNVQDSFETDTDQITFISDLSFEYSPLDGCAPLA